MSPSDDDKASSSLAPKAVLQLSTCKTIYPSNKNDLWIHYPPVLKEMEHASPTHLSVENQTMVDVNYSDEHEEDEVLPFALSEYPDDGSYDCCNQRRRARTKIQNTMTAEIALERATHSHSHNYSIAGDNFLSQVGALKNPINLEISQNTEFHIQSDSIPSATAEFSPEGERQVMSQIESFESAGLEQKVMPSLNRWETFDHIASSSPPPFTIAMDERRQTKSRPSLRAVEMERAGQKKTLGDVVSGSPGDGDQFARLSSGCMDILRKAIPAHQDESKSVDVNNEGCLIENSGSLLAIADTSNYSMSSYHTDCIEYSGNEILTYPSSAVSLVSPSYSATDHQLDGVPRSKFKESLNGSISIRQQRDDDTVLLENLNDSFIGLQSKEHKLPEESSGSRGGTVMFSSTMSSMSAAVGPYNSDDFDRYCSPIIVQDKRDFTRETITAQRKCLRSFEVAVPMPPYNTVREVMDVLSNPDLLRIWYEPVNALIVTDRKGGLLPSASPPFYSDGFVNNIGMYRNPSFEEKEEYDEGDGDVIIGSASEEKAMITDKQREQPDGEWIQASTTTLTSPYAHTNLLARSFESSRAAIGFPSCGNINMFIERNKAQVGLSIGPFKGGTILSHTITVLETRGENDERSITLIDDVKILDRDEEHRMCCSCFDMIQWTVPSVDGYMDQTIKSLENLRTLVQSRGSMASVRNSNIASRPEEDSTMMQPLLG